MFGIDRLGHETDVMDFIMYRANIAGVLKHYRWSLHHASLTTAITASLCQ